MSNTEPKLEPTPANHTKASTSRKLIQAAALAAMLVPLGSVAVEADSIICGFSPSFEGIYGGSGSSCSAQQGEEDDFSATPTTSRFNFGAYYLELMFDGVSRDFNVEVVTTENSAFVQGKAGGFPGYTCIGITADEICVDFVVKPSVPRVDPTGQVNWTGYEIEINWQANGVELTEDLMTMLHDRGDSGTRDYDFDMCASFPAYDGCTISTLPLIRSGDTDFRSFAAFERGNVTFPQAVPEPASLVLLGTGIGGILLRRRRRS